MPSAAETPSNSVVSCLAFFDSSMTIIMPNIPTIPDTIAGVIRLFPDKRKIRSVVNTDDIKLIVAFPDFWNRTRPGSEARILPSQWCFICKRPMLSPALLKISVIVFIILTFDKPFHQSNNLYGREGKK